jgi:hypothetical protein
VTPDEKLVRVEARFPVGRDVYSMSVKVVPLGPVQETAERLQALLDEAYP